MKRFLIIILSCALLLSACERKPLPQEMVETAVSKNTVLEAAVHETAVSETEVSTLEIPEEERGDDTPYEYLVDFDSLDDSELDRYVQDSLYLELVSQLDSDRYFVENISTSYISQEYIDELAYNSKPNIYFGYTLEELNSAFEGTRYVFTLGEEGETIAVPFEDYDDTYEQVLKNVAIGTGVILLSVTVTLVTAPAAPAVSMIFMTAAKTGTIMALSSGALGAVASGIVTGIETGNMDKALKAAALSGSEGFMWGAITGAISGGTLAAITLKGASLNGLTMNQVAKIQKESKYPIDLIKQFHNIDEYNVFKAAELKSIMINGKQALVRTDINLGLVDEFGRNNLERMKLGLSALDENGKAYELHHIGQNVDASLAILTNTEHHNAVLHGFKVTSEILRDEFAKQRTNFWKTYVSLLESGGI